MTLALSGRTTKLIRNNVIVAEIMGIPDEDYTSDAIDATNSDSLLGFREYVSGPKTGTFSVSGNLIPGDTGQDGIRSDFEGGTSQNYELAFPNEFSSSCELSAIVTDYSEEYPYDGVVKFNASFQVTGAATFIEYSGSAGLTTPFFVVTGDDSGVLTSSPTASGSVYEYQVSAGAADTEVTITPTAAAGTIYVNGSVVSTGVASGAISLGASGTYSNIFIEVKETSKSPKIYIIEMYRSL